jgi:acetyl esterase
MSDPYVRQDVRLFLDHYNKLPGPRAHEVGPSQARATILASRRVADAEVGPLAAISDLACPGPAGEIRL